MGFQKFLAPLVALAFATAPVVARASTPMEAQIAPAAVKTAVVQTPQQVVDTGSELQDLAARDASSKHLEQYAGGEPVVIVSGAVLGTVLLVVLILVLVRALGDSGGGGGKTVVVD